MADNLPHQLTSFIGREHDIAELRRQLLDVRLITLTGTGGTGKTRLALEIASRSLDMYPDGVWLVELAALSDAEAVPQAVASVLGVRETADRSLLVALIDYVRTRKLLLILDNCEHLITSCAHLAHNLLRNSTHLRILATSRQAFGFDGECVWSVSSLALPEATSDVTLELASECEAIRLFVERARLRRSDFALSPLNVSSVVRVCAQLDALPLAIELAAARVRAMSVDEMVVRLGKRFQLLTSTSEVVEPRHRTLTTLLDWSYELLNERERILFCQLSVFSGGCTLQAITAVCRPNEDEGETIDLIYQLVEKSLLMVEEHEGQTYYRLLDTIRQYAWEKLQSSGEVVALRNRHLEYYLGFAEDTEDELLSERQSIWLARLEREYSNLRAALDWSQVDAVDPHLGLRLAGALVWFWYFRGYLTEARNELETAIERAQRALLSREACDRQIKQHERDGGEPFENTIPWATILTAAGTMEFLQGNYVVARRRLEQGLQIWRILQDKRGAGFALAFLGRVALRQGDPGCAAYGEESITCFREVNEKWGLALSLDFLGEVAREAGYGARAAAFHEESLELYRELRHRWGVALELSSLGRVATQRGDYPVARSYLEEALGIQREVGDKWMLAWTLRNLADVIQAEGEFERAKELLAESLAVFQELDDKKGTTLTLDDISNLEAGPNAEGTRHRQQGSASSVSDEQMLTSRQVEVLKLIADGLTDAQIADQLCISLRTVQAHIRAIYAKLGITSRSAATRYVLETGLQ